MSKQLWGPSWLVENIDQTMGFPNPEITFLSFSRLLANPACFERCIEAFCSALAPEVNCVVGVDARGFIFASAIALKMKIPLILMRKKGKLPPPVYQVDYDLEYGSAAMEVRQQDLHSDMKPAVIDDVLATGGTLLAAHELLQQAGLEKTQVITLIEIDGLNAREKLSSTGMRIDSLVHFKEV